jgi:hypothetical protein
VDQGLIDRGRVTFLRRRKWRSPALGGERTFTGIHRALSLTGESARGSVATCAIPAKVEAHTLRSALIRETSLTPELVATAAFGTCDLGQIHVPRLADGLIGRPVDTPAKQADHRSQLPIKAFPRLFLIRYKMPYAPRAEQHAEVLLGGQHHDQILGGTS